MELSLLGLAGRWSAGDEQLFWFFSSPVFLGFGVGFFFGFVFFFQGDGGGEEVGLLSLSQHMRFFIFTLLIFSPISPIVTE